MDNMIKNILLVFLFTLIFYLLSALSTLIIPLVLALLFAAMFHPLITKLSKSKIPNFIIMPIIIIITLAIIFGISNLIITTISQISSEQEYLLSRLSLKLDNILNWINSIFGYELNSKTFLNEVQNIFDTSFISSAVGNLASGLGSFTGSFLMFALYYIIFVGGMIKSEQYISYIGGNDKEMFIKYSNQIQSSIVKYMMIKTLISLSTGILVTIACLIFNIKFAILWGFLTFIFNYVPSIGSIIATIPPLIMSFIQFNSMNMVFLFLLILASIQFTIGSLIEPKIMGNNLKLNTITVIFGLVFWGYIWGIAGMLLSVPLLVILKLIFEQIPSLQIISRIMGTPDYK